MIVDNVILNAFPILFVDKIPEPISSALSFKHSAPYMHRPYQGRSKAQIPHNRTYNQLICIPKHQEACLGMAYRVRQNPGRKKTPGKLPHKGSRSRIPLVR